MAKKLRQFSRVFEEYTTLISSFFVNLAFYRRSDLASVDIKRIAIIKLDHIGDVILSIPAVASLRAQFPRAHITMVVASSSELIAEHIPHVDEILCYDARFFDKSGCGRMFDFSRGLRFSVEMRRREFDLIVDLRGSFASLWFAVTAKCKHRIDRGTYLVQRRSGKIASAPEHEAEVNLDILARAGVSKLVRKMSLELEEADVDNMVSLLGEKSSSPVVVIHSGSPTLLKCWSTEKYAQLADKLLREYGARIVLVGAEGEKQAANSVASAVDNQVTNLSGQTTLGQLAAILSSSDLFIGNDSGPMHIAAACGTKVIGLFGPTSPQRFGPYGDNCIALRMETGCSPCMKKECRRPGYRCVDSISVEDVMEITRKMLRKTNIDSS